NTAPVNGRDVHDILRLCVAGQTSAQKWKGKHEIRTSNGQRRRAKAATARTRIAETDAGSGTAALNRTSLSPVNPRGSSPLGFPEVPSKTEWPQVSLMLNRTNCTLLSAMGTSAPV